MNEQIDPTPGKPVIEWARAVVPVVKAAIPRSAVGGLVRRKGSGFSIEIPKAKKRSAEAPFFVSRKSWETSEDGLTSITLRVGHGTVFLSEDWEDTATITGLTTTDCELSAEGDSVWLELHQFGTGTPTITLRHGATWADYPKMWKYVAPVSESADPEFYWYQRLAFLRAPRTGEVAMNIGGTELVLQQVVKTDLIRRSLCVESVTLFKVPQLHPWY